MNCLGHKEVNYILVSVAKLLRLSVYIYCMQEFFMILYIHLDLWQKISKVNLHFSRYSHVKARPSTRYGWSGHGRTTFLAENCVGRTNFSAEYDLFFIFSAELLNCFMRWSMIE